MPNSDTANLIWEIFPPNMGSFSGPSTGQSVSILWEEGGTAQLCAIPANPCYEPPPCLAVNIDPVPFVDPIDDITICGGTQLTIDFTGTPGATFNWTNTNLNIGLPYSGTGGIDYLTPDLTIGFISQTGTITVTPMLGGCAGPPADRSRSFLPAPAGARRGRAGALLPRSRPVQPELGGRAGQRREGGWPRAALQPPCLCVLPRPQWPRPAA